MNPRAVLFATLLLSLAACARTPPHQQVVDAASTAAFNQWRADASRTLSPEDWRWFDVAIQEFKLQLMLGGKTSGGAAIDTAVREKINGRPFIEVLREGLQGHLQRKTAERDDTAVTITTNDQKIRRLIKPGADDVLRDFNAHQEMLRQKLAKLEAEIATAQAALARFGG
jgi:uncharacterized lipoprotein YajG